MKNLYLIRGVPGCGKSTFAEILSKGNGAKICTADDYFMKDGEYNWYVAGLGKAHAWCKNLCEEEMIAGRDVIVANTNTTEKEINVYTKLAEKYDYRVFSVVVENRHGGENIHDVPEESIKNMKKRFSIRL